MVAVTGFIVQAARILLQRIPNIILGQCDHDNGMGLSSNGQNVAFLYGVSLSHPHNVDQGNHHQDGGGYATVAELVWHVNAFPVG